jgi:hypothetical protein
LTRLTELLFIITFATSIPPFVYFYAEALGDPAFILKGGFGRMTRSGRGGDAIIFDRTSRLLLPVAIVVAIYRGAI